MIIKPKGSQSNSSLYSFPDKILLNYAPVPMLEIPTMKGVLTLV